MIAGAADGSIHVWHAKRTYSRADQVVYAAHPGGGSITCVTVSADGRYLASRGANDARVRLWDLAALKTPLCEINGLPNDYPTANVDFR